MIVTVYKEESISKKKRKESEKKTIEKWVWFYIRWRYRRGSWGKRKINGRRRRIREKHGMAMNIGWDMRRMWSDSMLLRSTGWDNKGEIVARRLEQKRWNCFQKIDTKSDIVKQTGTKRMKLSEEWNKKN